MTATVAAVVTLVQAQAAAAAAQGVAAQTAIAAYLAQWGQEEEQRWYARQEIVDMTKALARISDSFSTTAARISDSFWSDAIEHLNGKAFRPVGIRKSTGVAGERGVRDNVTTAEVFVRAASQYRFQQSRRDKQFIADVTADQEAPTVLAMPTDAAIDRASKAAQFNVQLAMRKHAQVAAVTAADKGLITGTRRILHPELASAGDCGMCIAASTRIYRADTLMPIHPGCHCVPFPVAPGRDPAAEINVSDLNRFYADAGEKHAELLKTRYRIDEHGEVGPLLRPANEPIRSKAEADRARRDVRPKSQADMIRTLRSRRDALATAHGQKARTPAWGDRLDEVQRRIASLEQQIVKLGG